MKAPFAGSLILILATTSSTAAADEVLRTHRFDTTGVERLNIEYRAGDLVLAPAESDQIEVELRVEPQPKWSGDVADLDVTYSVRGDRFTLRFGEDGVRSHMLVRVPSLEQLTIHVRAGDIQGTVPPMETEVFLAAGDINLEFDRTSTGRVDLRARIGDTAVQGVQNAETNRVILVGSTSSAAGEGAHRVEAKVRVGEVRVGLR